jgi:predicted O-linked N-acetylglucosamine transferase (SPINDLY family)
LDTLPYNAGTTASDALWAGLPVLTCTGESFASRVAASLLTTLELPDLITSTQAEYERRAIALATDAGRLAQVKQRLAVRRTTAVLFDTRRFARHLENGFRRIYERYQAGLPPEHTDSG